MRKTAKRRATSPRNIVTINVDAVRALLRAGHPLPTVTLITKNRPLKRRTR
jgi:hypothetical protein